MSRHISILQSFLLLLFFFLASLVQSAPPPFLVFGDSLVDNGNNNYLATSARADSPPYGIDFYPSRQPTGRFSNGFTTPDLISQKIGAAETSLPYLSPDLVGEKLLIGANFASAGIGILNDTGIQFVNIIRMYDQLRYFEEYKERVGEMIGEGGMQELVANSLVLITLGGNDFVNNYYLVPFSLRSTQYSLPDYCALLISEYQKILLRLYELGARKVMVTGTGPMGCVPAERAMRGKNGECAEELQRAASIFNPLLTSAISNINSQIGTTVFIAANAYQMKMDVITDPQSYGFTTSRDACCGQGPYNGIGLCSVASNLCKDREVYVFWDQYHPTERTNRIIVDALFSGSQSYMYPMNLTSFLT